MKLPILSHHLFFKLIPHLCFGLPSGFYVIQNIHRENSLNLSFLKCMYFLFSTLAYKACTHLWHSHSDSEAVQHYVLLLYSSGEWPQGFYLSAAASTRLGTLHTKEDTVLVFLNSQSHFVIN